MLCNKDHTSLCNHWTLQFPYLYLRPPYLTLSDLTLLSLVLQHSCAYQNSQAPAILNSAFVLQTFRLILQNLQKLLIFPMSLLSIMNSPTFLAKLKLKSLLLIVCNLSKQYIEDFPGDHRLYIPYGLDSVFLTVHVIHTCLTNSIKALY